MDSINFNIFPARFVCAKVLVGRTRSNVFELRNNFEDDRYRLLTIWIIVIISWLLMCHEISLGGANKGSCGSLPAQLLNSFLMVRVCSFVWALAFGEFIAIRLQLEAVPVRDRQM